MIYKYVYIYIYMYIYIYNFPLQDDSISIDYDLGEQKYAAEFASAEDLKIFSADSLNKILNKECLGLGWEYHLVMSTVCYG